MRHYAALLVALANAITASAGAIPAQYAGIAPALVVILYAVAGVKQPSNSRPGKIAG